MYPKRLLTTSLSPADVQLRTSKEKLSILMLLLTGGELREMSLSSEVSPGWRLKAVCLVPRCLFLGKLGTIRITRARASDNILQRLLTIACAGSLDLLQHLSPGLAWVPVLLIRLDAPVQLFSLSVG